MSFRPISFVVFVLLILSCGSSKQIASAPKEETIQKEEENADLNVALEAKVKIDVEETETIESPTEIESTEVIQESETQWISAAIPDSTCKENDSHIQLWNTQIHQFTVFNNSSVSDCL